MCASETSVYLLSMQSFTRSVEYRQLDFRETFHFYTAECHYTAIISIISGMSTWKVYISLQTHYYNITNACQESRMHKKLQASSRKVKNKASRI